MTTRSAARPLSRLVRNTAGNTLAMMAASLIPLIGMVGGAVDMSRLYLVKTRLQQACDAGSLAARRTMTTATLNAEARAQAQSFFNINLRNGSYGAQGVSFAVRDVMNGSTATGRVAGTAGANVPLSIMHMFGFAPVALQATCEAELNVTNNDIMFVLDVTGSMACLPTDHSAQCQTYVNANGMTNATTGQRQIREQAGSRIVGLRNAVQNFYAALSAATTAEARLRVGFVPYSSGINMAGILPAGTLRTGQLLIQTRVANMTTPVHTPTFGNWSNWSNTGTSDTRDNISSVNCTNYGNNVGFTQDGVTYTPQTPGNPTPAYNEVKGGAKPADAIQTEFRRKTSEYNNNKKCERERRTRSVTYTTSYAFTNWSFRPRQFDLPGTTTTIVTNIPDTARTTNASPADGYTMLQLAQMQAVGTASGMTTQIVTRDNCVMERETGMDDISMLAADDATRWAPTWPSLASIRIAEAPETRATIPAPVAFYNNPIDNGLYACPAASQRLAVSTQAQVNAFVNGPAFVPNGGTYHDIGMIWGARLMSPSGVFAADHGAAPNQRPVSRHIIFMTDGEMAPTINTHSPYGAERNSRRRQPSGALSDASLTTAHNAAFRNICATAQAPPINAIVWVVAFGQALTPDLIACAGDTTRDFTANDASTLNAQFQEIAQRIAELRLSQ